MIKSTSEHLKDEEPVDRKLVINSYREQLKSIQAQIDLLDIEQYRLLNAIVKCKNQVEQTTIVDQLNSVGMKLDELRSLYIRIETEYFENIRKIS